MLDGKIEIKSPRHHEYARCNVCYSDEEIKEIVLTQKTTSQNSNSTSIKLCYSCRTRLYVELEEDIR